MRLSSSLHLSFFFPLLSFCLFHFTAKRFSINLSSFIHSIFFLFRLHSSSPHFYLSLEIFFISIFLLFLPTPSLPHFLFIYYLLISTCTFPSTVHQKLNESHLKLLLVYHHGFHGKRRRREFLPFFIL